MHRVGSKLSRVEPDTRNPFLHEPSVLPSGQAIAITAICSEELTGLPTRQLQILVDRLPRLVRQFEPNGPACLFLADRCTIHSVPTRCNVIHANGDPVAAAQLAIDSQIEEGTIPFLPLDLQLRSDWPDIVAASRRRASLVSEDARGLANGDAYSCSLVCLSPCLRDRPSLRRFPLG